MGVIIGIDYGNKRIGLAHTDPKQIIASGLCTLTPNEVIQYLENYQKQTPIEKFVVGQPKQRNGNYSDVEKDILVFINDLEKNFESIPVVRQDERFTSKIAFNSLIESGAKKKTRKNKALVDQISATLILQSFLESNSKPVI
tara:strand:+ start:30039 stop:30464 length:426 start_codon:yes stop_codon:yes gene_type:complete